MTEKIIYTFAFFILSLFVPLILYAAMCKILPQSLNYEEYKTYTGENRRFYYLFDQVSGIASIIASILGCAWVLFLYCIMQPYMSGALK